jgi:hypothetical protein
VPTQLLGVVWCALLCALLHSPCWCGGGQDDVHQPLLLLMVFVWLLGLWPLVLWQLLPGKGHL